MADIDPVCAFHGKRASEHLCLYCCLCFKTLKPEECWEDENGQKWDKCVECGQWDAYWSSLTHEQRKREMEMMARHSTEHGT